MNALVDPPSLDSIWQWLAEVPDPEIPVISITDLGIVREVRYDADQLVVTVTPTYSGCPATEVIAAMIQQAMAAHGIGNTKMETRLSPAWTTDWLTPEAKLKLRDYGIAPPVGLAAGEQRIDISRLSRQVPDAPVVPIVASSAIPASQAQRPYCSIQPRAPSRLSGSSAPCVRIAKRLLIMRTATSRPSASRLSGKPSSIDLSAVVPVETPASQADSPSWRSAS